MGEYTYLVGLLVLGAIIFSAGMVSIKMGRKAQHQAEQGRGSAALPVHR